MRYGRVPELYGRIAAAVSEAKALNSEVSLPAAGPVRPAGRPTTHYVWRTAGDNRVRDTHAARDGQIFAWADRPDHGHPGTEPNCRCWPEPYYGDPAVPDALLHMVPARRVNTDSSVLWADIDTLTRPDGSIAQSAVVMNDGTHINSTFAGTSVDHVVTLSTAAALRVQKEGGARTLSVSAGQGQPLQVAWVGRTLFPRMFPPVPITSASEPPAVAKFPGEDPLLAGAVSPVAIIARGALALYNLLQSAPDALGAGTADVPVVVTRVWQSQADGPPILITEALTLEQVSQMCPRADDVQGFIDLAAAEWAPLASTMNKATLGTKIHVTAKNILEDAKLINPALYGNLHAEVSLDWEAPGPRLTIGVTYGTAGSTRLDVMELVNPQMGCVYDYKTGQAGLTAARVSQIIEVWNVRFPGVPVIILEMRQYLPVWTQ